MDLKVCFRAVTFEVDSFNLAVYIYVAPILCLLCFISILLLLRYSFYRKVDSFVCFCSALYKPISLLLLATLRAIKISVRP